ncbi:MAG TPA: hypothetical protein VM509_06220, partial [Planctomycetota bacterium]|nr:hypothetical protein [Planctomycetota bacterium]
MDLQSKPQASHVHDPKRWRKQFPILESTTYLVTHSLGAMPAGVYDKLRAYADQWATRGVRAWAEGWWDAPLAVGNLLGRLMNAPAGSVVMHQNVSVIESLIASCLDFGGKRNRVVYDDQNFPTNMYVWEGYRKLGAEIVCLPSRGRRGVPLEEMLAAIDERTLIVPISHVCFRNSWKHDAKAICARAGSRRARPARHVPGARHGARRRAGPRRRHGVRRLREVAVRRPRRGLPLRAARSLGETRAADHG